MICLVYKEDTHDNIRSDVLEVESLDPCQVLDIKKVKGKEEEVFRGAIEIWKRFYGVPRASGSDNRIARRDLGCPRKPPMSSEKPSLHGWMQEQGFRVSRRVKMLTDLEEVVQNVRCPDMWTEKHEKEMKFIEDWPGLGTENQN